MMRNAAFVLVALAACYTGRQQPPPGSYPQQQWGQQAGGEYFCSAMESRAARGSVCYAYAGRCEDERRKAESDGLQASPCRPQSPVACFQLAGDPSPSMETCAARVEDCDLLRLIDRDKNGRTGAACEWRHGPGLPR